MEKILDNDALIDFMNLAAIVVGAIGLCMAGGALASSTPDGLLLGAIALVTLASASMIAVTVSRSRRGRRGGSPALVTLAIALTVAGVADFVFALVAG